MPRLTDVAATLFAVFGMGAASAASALPSETRIVATDPAYLADGLRADLPVAALSGEVVVRGAPGADRRIVFLPGTGLDHTLFTARLDDGRSWSESFARAGWQTFAWDDPTILARPEDVAAAAQVDRRVPARFWSRWGIGAAPGRPYADTQFPADRFDLFAATLPRFTSYGFGADAAVRDLAIRSANLETLLDGAGPSVLVAHASAGSVASRLAAARPDLVSALVFLEAGGLPSDPVDLASAFGAIPVLGVYGDHMGSRGRGRDKALAETVVKAKRADDGLSHLIDLPGEGVAGNSHLIPLDRNAEHVAERVIEWLGEVRGA